MAGKWLGLCTLLLDGLKGAALVIFARYYLLSNFFAFVWLYVVGLAAILGHIFPIYLKFKGGKGVATTLAVFLAVDFRLGILVALSSLFWHFQPDHPHLSNGYIIHELIVF